MKKIMLSLTLLISAINTMYQPRSLKSLCIVAASKDLADQSEKNANQVLKKLPIELREPTESKYYYYKEVNSRRRDPVFIVLNNTFKFLNHCFPEKHDKYWDALHRTLVPIGLISTGLFIYYAYNGQFG